MARSGQGRGSVIAAVSLTEPFVLLGLCCKSRILAWQYGGVRITPVARKGTAVKKSHGPKSFFFMEHNKKINTFKVSLAVSL